MSEPEQFNERLRAGEPLVRLTDEQATSQAIRLHEHGVSWTGVEQVMRMYHGYYLSRVGWWYRARRVAQLAGA